MEHLFLADVHLGAFNSEVNDRLENEVIQIVEYCAKNNIRLHILGDLFDYWMEFPRYTPEIGNKLLASFEEFNKTNEAATYITGNHDNWTFGYFEERGFNVEADQKELTINNKKVLIHHGDGLSDPAFGLRRPFFHRLLRNKWFVKFYQLLLPAEAGLHLMKQFSSNSKENHTLEPERLNKWAEEFLRKSSFDVVICGHDHIARVETFPFGTYINTGAFFSHRTLVYYTNETFKLVSWNSEESQLKPYITPD